MPITVDGLPHTSPPQQAEPGRTSTARAQGAKTNPGHLAAVTKPTLDDLQSQLDALTGLAPVKAEVGQLINIVRVERMRRAAGLPVTPVSRHLVFTGNPWHR
jgi:hypothetical protein